LRKTESGNAPLLLVLAGPNGSGKSFVTRSIKTHGLYINADDIKRLNKNISEMEAAMAAEELREYCLRSRMDFTFETVLSTNRNLDLIARAKKAGYFIDCYFVLTTDPELNVRRVKSRVSNGGHGVPIDKIRSRYKKSLGNIPALIELCDIIRIVDNTDKPFIIYKKDIAGNEIISENKYWARKRIVSLIKSPAFCWTTTFD